MRRRRPTGEHCAPAWYPGVGAPRGSGSLRQLQRVLDERDEGGGAEGLGEIGRSPSGQRGRAARLGGEARDDDRGWRDGQPPRGANELEAVAVGEAHVGDEERERLALEYADRVSATPVDVPDEFFETLQRLFSEREIVELTAHIAHESYNAKSNRPLRVEANNFCAIPLHRAKV